MIKAESQVSSNGADGGGGTTTENNEEKIYEKQTTTGRIVDSVSLGRVTNRPRISF